MQKEYILNRSGVIMTTPEQATEFQCVKKAHNKYYYWVQVLFHNPVLDTRGFLADHTDLENFITNEFQSGPIPSCELLIDKVGIAVAKWLAGQSMPATSVYVKFASTHEGSEGFIEGTIFPSDTDNQVWEDRARGALPYLNSNGEIRYEVSLPSPVFKIVQSEVNSTEQQCEVGTRRFKTIKEIFDTPGVGIGTQPSVRERVTNIEAPGFLTMDDLSYINHVDDKEIPSYFIEQGYYKFHVGNDFYAIPIWATTCKPLN